MSDREDEEDKAKPAAVASPRDDERRRLTRRELLRVGTTGLVGLATVGAGIALVRRDGQKAVRRKELPTIRDHRMPLAAGAVQMAIARGTDRIANVRKAVEAIGGMAAFVKRGESVVVKPNVGWNRLPEQAANTDPDVVAEIVRLVLAAGASRVWVTDVPVNTPEQTFARSGIKQAAEAAGAKVVLPDGTGFREVKVNGRLLQTAELLFPFVEADRIINVPVVKHHSLSAATMAMKNWYGVLGGQRVKLHQNIHLSIADLASMMKPTLTIMDGTRVLMANGPTGGNLADVKRMDTIAAGVDEVALDAFGATLLGLTAGDVGSIAEGMKAGLGTSDWKSLKLVEIGG